MSDGGDCNSTNETSDQTEPGPENDKELQELLSSALEDFDKSYDVQELSKVGVEESSPSSTARTAHTQSAPEPGEVSGSETAAADAVSAFDQVFHSLLEQQPELISQLDKLAAAGVDGSQGEAVGTAPVPGDLGPTLAEAMQSLSRNANNLQAVGGGGPADMGGGLSESDMIEALQQLGLGGDGGSGTDGGLAGEQFMSGIQHMVESILSKDVLYPSLKEITDKYPAWLEDNKSTLSSTEYDRYNKQNELMAKVCREFESEAASDSDDAKKVRFETVIDLMQQIQDSGHPPTDLVGEMPNLLEFDENGLPKLPENMPADACNVM